MWLTSAIVDLKETTFDDYCRLDRGPSIQSLEGLKSKMWDVLEKKEFCLKAAALTPSWVSILLACLLYRFPTCQFQLSCEPIPLNLSLTLYLYILYVLILYIYLFLKINSYFIFYLFYLYLAVLALRFCARAFSSCGKRGPLFITVRGPFTIAAPPVVGHRLQTRRLSNCGSRAQLLRGMWDPPRPGLEPVSPALAGRLSTTAPPGKPYMYLTYMHIWITLYIYVFIYL